MSYFIEMNLLIVIFQLLGNLSILNKHTKMKIFFELGNTYQLELNVSNIELSKKKMPKNDCALIPLDQEPKHEPICEPYEIGKTKDETR